MLDKYDFIYGVSKYNKRQLKYIIYTALSIVLIELIFLGKLQFVFKTQTSLTEQVEFVGTAYFFGLTAYFLYLYVRSIKSIKQFQNKKNQLLMFHNESINAEQIEAIKRKAAVRNEILNILTIENLSRKKDKKLDKLRKEIGNHREILAKSEYLKSVKFKAESKMVLKKDEIDYLNELVFSEKDLEMYRSIHKIFKKSTK